MKLLILSDANSTHTLKWIQSLCQKESYDIFLFSFFKPNSTSINIYKKYNIKFSSPNLESKIRNIRRPNLSKIIYLKSLFDLKKIIKKFKPDIVHAHYASSYGVLGLLTGFKPFILSVWGSDIYHFPYLNPLNKIIMKKIIHKSDKICSSSIAMKKIITKEYGREEIEVVPFGIDTDRFKPNKQKKNQFVVGTIKSIENHNGIECLLDAAKIVIHDLKKDINFVIVGEGSLRKQMESRAIELKIEKMVKFLGYVNHEKVYKHFQNLSLFVAVSKRESFGVSILEAAACEVPSITSNIGGLPEVNIDKLTGIVIKPDNPIDLAGSIIKLYENKDLRTKMGKSARERVIKKFNWKDNVNEMIKIYNSSITL